MIPPRPLVDINTAKNIFQGALGAVAFGAYHQFSMNKLIELNEYKYKSEITELHKRYQIEINDIHLKYKIEMEIYRNEISKLNEKIDKIEKRRWWN